MKSTLLILCSLIIFCNCRSPQALHNSIQSTAALQAQALQHVHALNQRQFNNLEQLYADDFSSWAPQLTFESKAVLLQTLRKNYQSSDHQIEAQVMEVEAGQSMGYVLLDWVLTAKAEGGQRQPIFRKHLLEIWKKNPQGNWTLSKMLFYQPEGGYGTGG